MLSAQLESKTYFIYQKISKLYLSMIEKDWLLDFYKIRVSDLKYPIYAASNSAIHKKIWLVYHSYVSVEGFEGYHPREKYLFRLTPTQRISNLYYTKVNKNKVVILFERLGRKNFQVQNEFTNLMTTRTLRSSYHGTKKIPRFKNKRGSWVPTSPSRERPRRPAPGVRTHRPAHLVPRPATTGWHGLPPPPRSPPPPARAPVGTRAGARSSANRSPRNKKVAAGDAAASPPRLPSPPPRPPLSTPTPPLTLNSSKSAILYHPRAPPPLPPQHPLPLPPTTPPPPRPPPPPPAPSCTGSR